MYKVLKKSIESNIPVLIEGYKGWGKTEIVKEIGTELGYKVTVVKLGEKLPDSFTVPVLTQNGFKNVGEESLAHLNEPRQLLFLDEINHAHPDVLNLLFGLVGKERTFPGISNPELRIVAAINMASENPYMTNISAIEPLGSRFIIKAQPDYSCIDAIAYLSQKYKKNFDFILKKEINPEVDNPRAFENAIKLAMLGFDKDDIGRELTEIEYSIFDFFANKSVKKSLNQLVGEMLALKKIDKVYKDGIMLSGFDFNQFCLDERLEAPIIAELEELLHA